MVPIRVMLVDDHAIVRECLRRFFSDEEDFEIVGEAANGLEAIATAKAAAPDVILMDVVMPRIGGIEATRQIKKTNPAAAVLILSAYDDDCYILSALEAGAAGYLLKTGSATETVQAIRAVYAGEAVLHPAVAARLLAQVTRTSSQVRPFGHGDPLTERELDVLRRAAKGCRNKEIAAELALTLPTVKAHFVNIFNKMGVGSRTEAVMEAIRHGWVDVDSDDPESDATDPTLSVPNGLMAIRTAHPEHPQASNSGSYGHVQASGLRHGV